MSNNFEDIIKNKVNKYMEEIKVPENLGGIVMENFEKITKEEAGNENNVPKKKGKKVIKVSIAAVSAVALICTGIFIGSRFLGNSTVTVNNNGAQNSNMSSDNTNVNTEPETVQPETTELVTDAFTYTGTTKDGNNTSVSYKIPKINIESTDVSKINNEIDTEIILKAKELILGIDKGMSSGIYKIFYNYYINDNVLSVIIESDYDTNGSKGYKVYNIDIKTGKSISNEELISKKSMTKKQFEEKLTNAVKNKFIEKYGVFDKWMSTQDGSQNESRALYESQYNKTIGSSNCNSDTQMMYLDASGELNVVAIIYSLAGPDSYYHIVKLDDNAITNSNEKINLSKDEISKLETFINTTENNPFLLLDYNSPEDIFKNEKNKYDTIYSPGHILSYAIDCSKYASESTKEQNKVIWKDSNGEAMMGTAVITEEDMIKFFQEKLDYTFSKEILRQNFKSDFYSELNNVYVTRISDAIANPFFIKEGYKQNNKYYLTLQNKYEGGGLFDRYNTEFIEAVLVEKNGTYCFYSCNTNKVKELSKEQITKLESFFNKPENNSFILANYTSDSDLLENMDNQSHKGILKHSISYSSNCFDATKEQKDIIYKDSEELGDTFVITEDNLIKFFDEKFNGISSETLKQTFKKYFNKDLNMYVFTINDLAYTKATIKEGCKVGPRYYLTLNHGQNVVVFERSNGEIFFESCIGYDGTIGQ